jgi:hypothetical protein
MTGARAPRGGGQGALGAPVFGGRGSVVLFDEVGSGDGKTA